MNEKHINFIYKRFWFSLAGLLGWHPFVSIMSQHLDTMLKEGHDGKIVDIFNLPACEAEFQCMSVDARLLFEKHVDDCAKHHLRILEQHRIRTEQEQNNGNPS